MIDRPAYPSMLTESSPNTHLQKILSMEEQKTSMDRRARNGPSSMSVDGNRKLVKKAAEKKVKYGTTEGFDGPSLRSSTQTCFWADFS